MFQEKFNFTNPDFNPETLVQLLRWRAVTEPNKIAYTYLKDGAKNKISLTYGELDKKARAIASFLDQKGLSNERALLLYPPGLDYIAGFFGCLYAGVIAVPAYPPDPNRLNRSLPRLQAIVRDARATVALTTDSILYMIRMLKLGSKVTNTLEKLPFLRKFRTSMKYFSSEQKAVAESHELGNLQWISTDSVADTLASSWIHPSINKETISFLQYTSGSTGNPKGVMLSHANLMHNSRVIFNALGYDNENLEGVFWLPIYHDMGLIGGVIQPLYSGCGSTIMSPIAFLQHPLSWLELISKISKEHSIGTAAPNFAYDLCVKKATPEKIGKLDLSRWDFALSGAEPVRAQTIENFSKTFAPAGFRKEAFYPAYGLAEATLLVTGAELDKPPFILAVDKNALKNNRIIEVSQDHPNVQLLVSSGKNQLDQTTLIVDPDSALPCKEGEIGEIWVKGDSVSKGYYENPEATKETFENYLTKSGDGPFLRTGDLGFMKDEQLFVTGRLKDLIIIRGKNHYPQDIELTVEESHPELRLGCSAAFTVEENGQEELVVVAEVRRSKNANFDEIIHTVRQAVSENHDLQAHAIVLIKARSIHKTSSGKIMRRATKAAYLDDTLAVVSQWKAGESEPLAVRSIKAEPTISGAEEKTFQPPKVKSEPTKAIEAWLVAQLSDTLNLPAEQIDIHRPFVSFGMDSAQAVGLSGELEEWLGRTLSPTLVWDYPTIESLALFLSEGEDAAARGADKRVRPGIKYEPIAVIGLSARFPGAADINEFWEMLKSGKDGIREIPSERWDVEAYYDPQPGTVGKMSTKYGGFLNQVDQFDPDFFGISPREARYLDPQQRLLLEVSYEALEHSGLSLKDISGSRTGVFIGISSNDYSRLISGDTEQITAYTGTGNAFSISANRLSYTFDTRGPSVAMDTACSSSLVAIHQACQSLQNGNCNMALAGGVNLILAPDLNITFSQAHMLSADGRCKTFDADADGYGRGEGAGIVVLKRLSDAIQDQDRILAVVRASAVNQDGRSNGITAPNGLAQQEVLRDALNSADLAPDQVHYIETHGTGTPLGDPIEIESIKKVMLQERAQDNPLLLGSVKTNIGHLESAAGIAGFIKTVLAIYYEEIPAHLNFRKLNPHINLKNVPIKITSEPVPWPRSERKRYAGVSAFGFGGTNAHVILEEAPLRLSEPNNSERDTQICTLSAKNKSALIENAERLSTFLAKHDTLHIGDVCFTLNSGRTHFEHRAAFQIKDMNELRSKLSIIAAGKEDSRIFVHTREREDPARVAFLFTGQGAQYTHMGQRLYETVPSFRDSVNRCSQILNEYLPRPLLGVLFPEDEANSEINETIYTQPALFTIEYALAKLWQSWGIQPAMLIGHSIGEYVAACLSGVYSLEEGLKLIAARGRLMQSLPRNGSMAVIFSDQKTVEKALEGLEDKVSIAGINGPDNVVISGMTETVQAIADHFKTQKIKVTYLTVSHAFHSPLMEPLLDEFETIAREIHYNKPQIPLVSNLIGSVLAEDQIPDAAYWRNHIRHAVRFYDGMKALDAAEIDIFLETGPHPTLLGMGRHCLPDSSALWIPSLRRNKPEWPTLLDSVAQLYVRGVDLNWKQFDNEYNRTFLFLPNYAFQHKRYWLDSHKAVSSAPSDSAGSVSRGSGHRILGRALSSPVLKETVFESTLSLKYTKELNDHRILALPLFPATGYLELLIAAVRDREPDQKITIQNFRIHSPLNLSAEEGHLVQTVLHSSTSHSLKASIFSKVMEEDAEDWTQNASATIRKETDEKPTPGFDDILTRFGETVDPEPFYQNLNESGFNYGPVFQALVEIYSNQGEALGKIRLKEQEPEQLHSYWFHPAMMDAGFQLLAAVLPDQAQSQSSHFIYLPVLVEELHFFDRAGEEIWAFVQLHGQSVGEEQVIADIFYYQKDGKPFAVLKGLHVQRTRKTTLMALLDRESSKWLYTMHWIQQKAESGNHRNLSGAWLLFEDEKQIGAGLEQAIEKEEGTLFRVIAGDHYERPQENVWMIRPRHFEDYQQLLSEVTAAGNRPLRGIIHLWSLDIQTNDQWSASDLMAAQSRSTQSILYLAQSIVSSSWKDVPPLWIFTASALSIEADELPNPALAPVWGLGRTMVLDHPDLPCRRIDIDPVRVTESWPGIAEELGLPGKEDQIAFRGKERFVARLATLEDEADSGLEAAKALRLTIAEKGLIDNLERIPMERTVPSEGQVEIRVRATGLNFRDVLNALDLYPGDAGPLGNECSGVVVATGPGVTDLHVGDEVMAIAAGSFADYVTTYADLVIKKPAGLTFTEAATIPITFLTAYYALYHLGKLTEGEHVFIHTASGGVGQAAIQLARLKNAEIFATAGSEEKRSFLRTQGIEHIMNSRSLDFARETLAATKDRGVDVILNSLTGDYIPKNLSLLGQKGRFLEIGKVGIWDEAKIHASRPDVDYHTIALDDLSKENPALIQSMFRELIPLFEEGKLQPLPFREFPMDEVVSAFRFMQQAKHIGKIVVSQTPEKSQEGSVPLAIKPEAFYLITGGLGSLGLKVAEWLVRNGARHIILSSRHEPQSAVKEKIERLHENGCEIFTEIADISDFKQTRELLDTYHIPQEGKYLAGIIHAAGVLDDGLLLQQSWPRFEKVMAPKVAGAWNLHQATKKMDLDFLVYFSSMASLLGSPGQSNYAAANAFLDALAVYRKKQNLPALSINWGPWSDSGMAARNQSTGARYKAGLGSIHPEQGLALLEKLIHAEEANPAVLPIRWKSFLKRFEGLDIPPVLRNFSNQSAEDTGGTENSKSELITRLEEAGAEDRSGILIDFLQNQAIRVLGLDSDFALDPRKPLSEMGLDSLMAIELKNALDRAVGKKLSATTIFNYPTIESLATYLLNDVLAFEQARSEEHGAEKNESPLDKTIQDIENLSDEEVEALLLQKLDEEFDGKNDRDGEDL